MDERCFRYNTQMILQYRVPVVTTVIYLRRSATLAESVFRVMLAGREINRWQFESLRLWEVEGSSAVAAGLPGLLALVPLMKGTDLAMIEASVLRIQEKAPAGQRDDLLAILYTFAEGRFDIERIQRIIGREKLMHSTLYQEAIAEGHLEKCRKLCAAVLRKWHPMLPAEAFQAIADCTDEELLDELILNASERGPDEIWRRLLHE